MGSCSCLTYRRSGASRDDAAPKSSQPCQSQVTTPLPSPSTTVAIALPTAERKTLDLEEVWRAEARR